MFCSGLPLSTQSVNSYTHLLPNFTLFPLDPSEHFGGLGVGLASGFSFFFPFFSATPAGEQLFLFVVGGLGIGKGFGRGSGLGLGIGVGIGLGTGVGVGTTGVGGPIFGGHGSGPIFGGHGILGSVGIVFFPVGSVRRSVFTELYFGREIGKVHFSQVLNFF